MKKRKKLVKKEDSEVDSKYYIFEDDDLIPFLDSDPEEDIKEAVWTVLGSGFVRKIDNDKTNLLNIGKIDGWDSSNRRR